MSSRGNSRDPPMKLSPFRRINPEVSQNQLAQNSPSTRVENAKKAANLILQNTSDWPQDSVIAVTELLETINGAPDLKDLPFETTPSAEELHDSIKQYAIVMEDVCARLKKIYKKYGANRAFSDIIKHPFASLSKGGCRTALQECRNDINKIRVAPQIPPVRSPSPLSSVLIVSSRRTGTSDNLTGEDHSNMPLQSPGRGREYRVSGGEDKLELESEIRDSGSLRGGSPTWAPSVYTFHPPVYGRLDYRSIIQPGVQLSLAPEPLEGKLLPEERIISGKHGDLYKGVWALSDYDYKPVALKCIRLSTLADDLGYSRDQTHGIERALERIVRETSIWMTMKHPNILPFYGYQMRSDELILVSMWSQKRSLDSFLALYPELTFVDKLELLHEAACGLEYLHSLEPPIAHGGIQPKNVIITDHSQAALGDVGLSRVLTNLGARTGLTTGGEAVEFAGYVAMEIFSDEASRPTAETDVYAFGGLILATLSGEGPFHKKRNSASVIIAIAMGSTPQPEDHPGLDRNDEIWMTLRACWDTIPDRRPTMTVIKEKLEAYISEYDGRSSDAPKRARAKIPTFEVNTTADIGKTGPMPRLSTMTDFLASVSLEESPFQSGAPIHELMPQYKLEGTLTKMEKMGSGGYGDVFQGVWKRSDEEVILVAIKSIRGNVTTEKGGEASQQQSDLMTRIIRETTIWKVVQHPNILSFYGYQVVGGEALLVSPWCKNGSLNTYIEKHKDLSDIRKLKLLCDAAQGLAYLHSRNPPIAHGDIKPQNVIITDRVEAALCDFGIARVMSDFTTGVTSRNPGAGTLIYQAKEQILDATQPTNMSDLYAFGGLILATMSGKPPFHQHKTTPSIVIAITQGQTPVPADHPELKADDPLWNLLRECWNSEPTERPSIKQVSAALDAEIRRRSMTKAD